MGFPFGGAGEIWRDGGAVVHSPDKAEIRNWGRFVEVALPYASLDDLLSDNVLGYGVAPVGAVVSVGGHSLVVAAEDADDYHLSAAGGAKLYAEANQQEAVTGRQLVFTNGSDANAGCIFKQADGADLSSVVNIALSNVTADERRADYIVAVDGNRDNNAASVIGIKVTKLKKGRGYADLAATNCDVGINITGNVEYARLDLSADGCGTGILVDPIATTTPDELLMHVTAHDCDTFFEATGATKMSGHVTFACEQSNSWGAKFDVGWWEIAGIIRGVGKVSDGGLLIDGDADIAGTIRIAGGDDVGCEYALDIQGGYIRGLTAIAVGSFSQGCRILGGAEGSMQLIMQSAPALTGAQVGLQMGDDGGSALAGFSILPGSIATSGGTAVDLRNAHSCNLDFSGLIGDVVIGAASYDNTIYVPRRNAEGLATFTNNREAGDNKIIYRGNFTRAEMNTLNGGTLFKGMEVEQCQNYDGARCYYDGIGWVPSHGVLATGTATIPIGSKNVSVAHGLGYDPGNHALQIMFESEAFGLGAVRGNVTETNVVILGENNVVGTDVDFVWTLRKVD